MASLVDDRGYNQGFKWTPTTEVRGRLMGPSCPYATTVEIAYAPVPAGAQHESFVTCPLGYRPNLGSALWIGSSRSGGRPGGLRAGRWDGGWRAMVATRNERSGTYELTLVCLPSRRRG